jgi:hypothetical protein
MTTIDHLVALRERYDLSTYIRRAVANQINDQWALSARAEQADRADRMEAIMPSTDFYAMRRALTNVERDKVRDALAEVPTNIRSDLELQASTLRTQVYAHLGTEHRRRIAEVRCMIGDAIESLDMLEFWETRRLVADAAHAIDFLLTRHTEADRPVRRKIETDHMLRERLGKVARHLRADANALLMAVGP